VERVLQRALAVDPRNRFANASEFWSQLREAAGVPVSSDGGSRRVTRTVDETEPPALTEAAVRTEIPAVVPTVQQVPAPHVQLARDASAYGSVPQPVPRPKRGYGCLLFFLVSAVVAACVSSVSLEPVRDRIVSFLEWPSDDSPPRNASKAAPPSSASNMCRVDARWAKPLRIATEEFLGGKVQIKVRHGQSGAELAVGKITGFTNSQDGLCDGYQIALVPKAGTSMTRAGFFLIPP
jgi:hypothetical protein